MLRMTIVGYCANSKKCGTENGVVHRTIYGAYKCSECIKAKELAVA